MDGDGYSKLWGWFGLSRASFLTLPRVLMHEMPDDWQGKMAALLKEYNDYYPNQPEIGTRVQATKGGRMIKWPEWALNYRHPDFEEIEAMKQRQPRES